MDPVFEWNPRKDQSNLKKHGIAFSEATSVFGDPLARIFADEAHSTIELREIIIGHSQASRLLLVCLPSWKQTGSGFSAHGAQPGTNQKTSRSDGLQTEYRFDYS